MDELKHIFYYIGGYYVDIFWTKVHSQVLTRVPFVTPVTEYYILIDNVYVFILCNYLAPYKAMNSLTLKRILSIKEYQKKKYIVKERIE